MSNKIRKFKFKRYQLQCQIFSCEAFTSSIGQIASEVLLQGFHLLNREDIFKPSLARFSPPRPGRSFSNLLMQGFHLLDRKSDQSCNSLWSYAFWLKTPYTGYGALVETPDFR